MISAGYSRWKGALGFVTSWILIREGQELFLPCTYQGEPEEQAVPAALSIDGAECATGTRLCWEQPTWALWWADVLQGPIASTARSFWPWGQTSEVLAQSPKARCVSLGTGAGPSGDLRQDGPGKCAPWSQVTKRGGAPQAVQWKRWGVRSSGFSPTPQETNPQDHLHH